MQIFIRPLLENTTIIETTTATIIGKINKQIQKLGRSNIEKNATEMHHMHDIIMTILIAILMILLLALMYKIYYKCRRPTRTVAEMIQDHDFHNLLSS